jgi:hypothetical protein
MANRILIIRHIGAIANRHLLECMRIRTVIRQGRYSMPTEAAFFGDNSVGIAPAVNPILVLHLLDWRRLCLTKRIKARQNAIFANCGSS